MYSHQMLLLLAHAGCDKLIMCKNLLNILFPVNDQLGVFTVSLQASGLNCVFSLFHFVA